MSRWVIVDNENPVGENDVEIPVGKDNGGMQQLKQGTGNDLRAGNNYIA